MSEKVFSNVSYRATYVFVVINRFGRHTASEFTLNAMREAAVGTVERNFYERIMATVGPHQGEEATAQLVKDNPETFDYTPGQWMLKPAPFV